MSLSLVATSRRDIVAPYQSAPFGTNEYNANAAKSNSCEDGNMNGVVLPSDAALANPSTFSSQSYPNYQNFQFKALEPIHQLVFDNYVGPTPESNWVVPGKLLVGAYPASADDAETLDLITSILKNGVTKFVCLQQEYREHGVTEAMWRSGQALRPYFEDVRAIVRKKHLIPCLAGHDVVSDQRLSFTHFPIRDCSVTDDDRVFELACSLVRCIAEGHVIYLHCWGGHGRTGTLVSIMLHLMYGMNDKEAMEYCQAVHDLRQCPVVVGSPQTQTQRDQVSRVIHSCITLNRLQKAQPAATTDTQSLPSPVARTGETLQSKLGSPRSATKLPLPAAAVNNAQNKVQLSHVTEIPNSSQGVAQCLSMPPLSTPGHFIAEQPQEASSEKGPEDTGSEESADAEVTCAEDAEDAEDAERISEGRMRLGTMDDSDVYREDEDEDEGAIVPLEVLSAEGGRLSLEEGEIVADEGMVTENQKEGEDVECAAAEDEVREADTVEGLAASCTAVPPNKPPAVSKPSYRPLWPGRNLAI